MTLEQRQYWFDIGRYQAASCLDEPEHGRMNKAEQACWWAGWWSYKANLPNPNFAFVAEKLSPMLQS